MLGVDQQAAERRAVCQCHRAHAPRARQLLRQPGEQRFGFPRRIAVAYRVEGEHVQIMGVEAGIDPGDVPVAGDDETGDQQQHEGRSHLGYHEEVAQAEPPVTAGPRGYPGLAAFFQGEPDIGAHTGQRGRQAAGDPGHQRDRQGERENAEIGAKVRLQRTRRGQRQSGHHVGDPVGRHDAGHASRER